MILKLAKISARKTFQNLRKTAPLDCAILNCEIEITRLFFNHIAYHQKKIRSKKDLIERLLITPLLSEILQTGKLTEKRNDKKFGKSFKISKKYRDFILSAIVQKSGKKHLLISCFRDFPRNKKDPSQPLMAHRA